MSPNNDAKFHANQFTRAARAVGREGLERRRLHEADRRTDGETRLRIETDKETGDGQTDMAEDRETEINGQFSRDR